MKELKYVLTLRCINGKVVPVLVEYFGTSEAILAVCDDSRIISILPDNVPTSLVKGSYSILETLPVCKLE